jgi:hypothetical protein
MNSDARIELVICGVLLIGLSLLGRHLELAFRTVPLLTALAGGVLCVVWGAARCRVGAMVTLPAAAGVLAWEGVKLWITAADAEAEHRGAAILMTLLVAFCVGTLANVAQSAGRQGE